MLGFDLAAVSAPERITVHRVAGPVIKPVITGVRRIGICFRVPGTAHVPFPVVRRLVPGLAQHRGQVGHGGIEQMFLPDRGVLFRVAMDRKIDPVPRRVLPGHHAHPRRRTDRGIDIEIGDAESFVGQLVEHGGLEGVAPETGGVTETPEVFPALVVGHDKDEIGTV